MENTVRWRLNGSAPVLMHNGRLSNPFNPFARAMKEVTDKKKKTEEDCLTIYWLEWCGSIYADPDFLPSQAEGVVVQPAIPAENLLSFINDGARHYRRGPDVWRGCQVLEPKIPLLGTGWPAKKKLGDIYQGGEFSDVRTVVNPSTGSRTQRCRPIFRQWSLEFSVLFDPEILNRSDLVGFVDRASRYNGLCDGKPLFGRCKAEVIGAEATDAA